MPPFALSISLACLVFSVVEALTGAYVYNTAPMTTEFGHLHERCDEQDTSCVAKSQAGIGQRSIGD